MLRFNSAERREDAGPTTLDYAVVIALVVFGFVVLAYLLRGTYVNTLYSAAWYAGAVNRPDLPTARPPVLPPSNVRSIWATKFPTAITDQRQRNGYIRRYSFADGSSAVYRAAYLDADGIAHKAVVEMTDAGVDLKMTVTVHPYGLFNQAAANPAFERVVRDAEGAIIASDFVQLSDGGVLRGTSTRVLRYYAPPQTEPTSAQSDVVTNAGYKSLLDDARYFLSIQNDAVPAK